MTAISAFLGDLPHPHVHGTDPQESTLLPARPTASHALLWGKGWRSAWDQRGAPLLLQTWAVPRVVSWCDASALYRLFWLRRLLESKLWSRLPRSIQIQPWAAGQRCGEDVWAGRGRKKLSPGPRGCALWWRASVSVLRRKTRPALNWLISVYMALTDVGRHTWHFYLCSHSRTSLVPLGCTVPKAGKEGALQTHVCPPGRAHGGRYGPRGVDGILDTPHLKLAMLPPSYLSRTSGARFWTQCLSPKAGGKVQLRVWGALTCQQSFVRDTSEAPCLGRMSGVEQRENNLFLSPPLPPDKTSVHAAACLREAPAGAGLWPRAHQLHGMPPCSLAGYVNAAASCEPDFVHRTLTFKARGNTVICLFAQDINKQVTDKRRREEKWGRSPWQGWHGCLAAEAGREGTCPYPCQSWRHPAQNSSAGLGHLSPLCSTCLP